MKITNRREGGAFLISEDDLLLFISIKCQIFLVKYFLPYPTGPSTPLKLLFPFRMHGPDLLSRAPGLDGAPCACLPLGTYATLEN
jgi:hypothetical protein